MFSRAFLLLLALGACQERGDGPPAHEPSAPPVAVLVRPDGWHDGGPPRAVELASGALARPLKARELDASATMPRMVTFAAGGDVNLARECGQEILRDALYDPFADLGAAWTSADLRFVNLESPLSEQRGETQHPRHRLIFTGPPAGAGTLARAGISLVSTANNHAWDYGKGAFFETMSNLERAGVPFAGTGRDLEEAERPVVLRSEGISVAVFAVTQIWNYGDFTQHEGRKYVAWASLAALRPAIERARREHDFVFVSYHGGAEYSDRPAPSTQAFMKALMALGVDAVLGHHPHVPQGIGWSEGRPIFYSLGNLAFAGHRERPWTTQSVFARLALRKGEKPKVSLCPYELIGHRPRSFDRAHAAAALALRAHVAEISLYVGGSELGELDELGCFTAAPPATKRTVR